MTLRNYQLTAVAAALSAMHRRPIIVAPTGSGKTVMGVAVAKHFRRTLWLAHRRELIDQAAAALPGTVGIIKADVRPTEAPIQVASVQTLARRELPAADLVVIDECHHATAGTYRRIIDRLPSHTSILGLTATPFRLDGRGLGDVFGELIVAATTRELCDSGTLVAPRVWSSRSPDLRGVRITGGDYNLNALAQRVNQATLIGDVVTTWQRRASGCRTVAFAVNTAHSAALAAAFTAAGVPAAHIDGATPADERADVLARLRAGDVRVVSNCMVLTEGWDLPALECAIIARPTASLNLHLQMVGRIMRACGGKAGAIVLDHAGNHHVHGLVTRELRYSLGSEKVGATEPLGLRRCPECGLMFALGEPACPECQWVPEVKRAGEITTAGGELTEFDDTQFDYRRDVWRMLEAERIAAGYAHGWSWYRYQERFGETPVLADIDGQTELVDTANASTAEKAAVYERLLRTAVARGFRPGWASHKYRAAFGVWPSGFVGTVKERVSGG